VPGFLCLQEHGIELRRPTARYALFSRSTVLVVPLLVSWAALSLASRLAGMDPELIRPGPLSLA
jgi:hypothetical protein